MKIFQTLAVALCIAALITALGYLLYLATGNFPLSMISCDIAGITIVIAILYALRRK